MERKDGYAMKIDYGLDKYYLPKKIHIIPSENEDPDVLHNMSTRLQILNPSLDFANAVKSGLYDKYSDEEYEKMLAVAKRLNLLFYSEKEKKALPSINIFDLTIRLLYEYMLNQHCEASRIL